MVEEKDMIEINLNTPNESAVGKGFNYFGNIRLSRNQSGGYPYGLYRNDDENEHPSNKKSSKLHGLSFTNLDQRPDKFTCLRQMYCPECQLRLDEDSVLLEKQGFCCIPLYSLNRFYQSCLQRYGVRRIYCKNCGGNMGFWKRA